MFNSTFIIMLCIALLTISLAKSTVAEETRKSGLSYEQEEKLCTSVRTGDFLPLAEEYKLVDFSASDSAQRYIFKQEMEKVRCSSIIGTGARDLSLIDYILTDFGGNARAIKEIFIPLIKGLPGGVNYKMSPSQTILDWLIHVNKNGAP